MKRFEEIQLKSCASCFPEGKAKAGQGVMEVVCSMDLKAGQEVVELCSYGGTIVELLWKYCGTIVEV